jgi:hypothetical protein
MAGPGNIEIVVTGEARAYLERLERVTAKLYPWKRVAEGMPTVGKALVVVNNGDKYYAVFMAGCGFCGSCGNVRFTAVTHWMYLNDLPGPQ